MRDLCKMLFISIMSTACQKPDDFLQSVFLTTIEDGQIAEAVRQPIRITAATITQRQETPNSVQALDVSRSHFEDQLGSSSSELVQHQDALKRLTQQLPLGTVDTNVGKKTSNYGSKALGASSTLFSSSNQKENSSTKAK